MSCCKTVGSTPTTSSIFFPTRFLSRCPASYSSFTVKSHSICQIGKFIGQTSLYKDRTNNTFLIQAAYLSLRESLLSRHACCLAVDSPLLHSLKQSHIRPPLNVREQTSRPSLSPSVQFTAAMDHLPGMSLYSISQVAPNLGRCRHNLIPISFMSHQSLSNPSSPTPHTPISAPAPTRISQPNSPPFAKPSSNRTYSVHSPNSSRPHSASPPCQIS